MVSKFQGFINVIVLKPFQQAQQPFYVRGR